MREAETTTRAREDLLAWRRDAARNAFDADPFFQHVLERLGLGPMRERLREIAAQAGPEMDARVRECNRDENLPVLRRHDAFGRPAEEIVFHPAHHDVGRTFWGSGVLAALAQPGSNVRAGAISYLLDQHGEAGHACPVACTAGAIKVIQRVGTDEQRRRYLPRLLDTDYDRRLVAGQLVTELQGGSDVGENACTAMPEPGREGWFRIGGEKWFCSVADADLFVVSARRPAGPAGTGGLGLFLVPRTIDGAPNGLVVRRLKYKLGTRSLPTGEFEFDGALAEAIGPPADGFRNLVGIVLDTSRVHNALGACGIMRRSLVEAHTFARHRRAFGRPVAEFPAVQELLAHLRLRSMAAIATTFRILAMTDRLETGGPDEGLAAARRIAVMINKYWTSVAATESARDGIEVLGGNGTIEDFSVLPRLYRDAIVLESWEGTHNTLVAQVLRDFTERGLHRSWLDHLEAEIGCLDHRELGPCAERARKLLGELRLRIDNLLAADETTAAAQARHVVTRMCRLTDCVALGSQADWERANGVESDTLPLLDLYRTWSPDRAEPQESDGWIDLQRQLARRI